MDKTSEALIIEELRRISRLLALLAAKDMAQAEQIDVLKRAGFDLKATADLLDTTYKTVSVTRAKNKKKRKPAKRIIGEGGRGA